MAAFCHFWRMTPAEVYALTPEEFAALRDYRNDEVRRHNRAARKRGRK